MYFTRYAQGPIDLAYLLLLPAILIFISWLLHKFIKRRKNENTGFIVFSGFKYFTAVLACLIIPASFSISFSRYTGVGSRLVISALLAVLSYYMIIAFIEKSFRVSRSSVKVFIVSMLVFAAITGGTVAVAGRYENMVPKPEDVQMAYVGNQIWSANSVTDYLEDRFRESLTFSEWKRSRNIVIYEDINSIKHIADLHREILKDQTYYLHPEYYGMGNFVIAYWMKDGTTLIRDYSLTAEDRLMPEHEQKNEISNKLLNSNDYKKQKFYYLYDEEYFSGRNLYAKLYNIKDYRIIIEDIELNDIRNLLKKDLDNLHIDKTDFAELFTNYREYSYKEAAFKKEGYILEIYEKLSDEEINYLDEIHLNESFTNTLHDKEAGVLSQ